MKIFKVTISQEQSSGDGLLGVISSQRTPRTSLCEYYVDKGLAEKRLKEISNCVQQIGLVAWLVDTQIEEILVLDALREAKVKNEQEATS